MAVPYDRRVGLYRRTGTGCTDVEPAKVCTTCLACLQERAEREEAPRYLGSDQFRHHRSLDAFGASVQQGCPLCVMLWRKLEEICPLDMASAAGHTEDQRIVVYRVDGGQTANEGPWLVGISLTKEAVSLLLRVIVDTEASVTLSFESHTSLRGPMHYLVGDDANWSSYEVASNVPTGSTTGDESVLELGSRWLTECSADHQNCQNADLEVSWLPLRLIEIRPTSGLRFSFRCVNARDDEVSAQRYLTLSYRWGSSDCLQLTTSTTRALHLWTDAQALPKTLREAFAVCSYLKVNYIWIDRLCIIQDDPQDWVSQAAQMDSVYANAFCNLAADASEHDDGGLFRTRDLRNLALLHYYREGRRGRVQNSVLLDISSWDSRITEAPLNQRAWVLQERFLSRRTLHFTKDQLIWECRERTATETFPEGSQHRGVTKQRALFQYPRYWAPEWQNKRCVNRCSICSSWYGDLVHPFTSASITFADDRPLAFAGVGKMVGEAIGDTYAAGMLLGHLRKQLLWRACQPSNRQVASAAGQRLSNRRFPSFSWLSLDCEIHHIGYNFRPEDPYFFAVHEVDLSPLALEAGQLRQAGRLQLAGFLVQINLTHAIDREGNNSWNLEKPGSEFRIDFAGSQARFVEENEGSPFPPFIYPDWTRKDLPLATQSTEHYLMLAAVEFWTVYFLILEEDGQEQGVYRRIGICGLNACIDRQLLDALGIHGPKETEIEEHALTRSSFTVL